MRPSSSAGTPRKPCASPANSALAPAGANRIIVDYQPIGICVLITPWNFPAAMATRKIAPALAAGCTVVLKPATETPLTAYALAALYEEAGVPPGVVNVLTTTTPGPVTAAMLADPRVRKLSFTGSTGVGRTLLAEAAKHVSELLDGARRQRAASSSSTMPISTPRSTARWSPRCATPARPARRPTASTSSPASTTRSPPRLTERMAGARRSGAGIDAGDRMRPDDHRARPSTRSTGWSTTPSRAARAFCAAARRRSARASSIRRPCSTDVPPDADMAHEEIFGPVAPLYRFETEDEVDRARQRHRIRAGRLHLHARHRRGACASRGASRPA